MILTAAYVDPLLSKLISGLIRRESYPGKESAGDATAGSWQSPLITMDYSVDVLYHIGTGEGVSSSRSGRRI